MADIRYADRTVFWLAVNIAALILLCLFAFHHNQNSLFVWLDGKYYLDLASYQKDWWGFGPSLRMDPLRGPGSLSFPTNTWFMPIFVVQYFTAGPLVPILVYVCLAVEAFIVTFFVGRLIELSRGAALLGGWIITLCTLPFLPLTLLFPFSAMIPASMEHAILSALICGLVVKLGDCSSRQFILLSLALVLVAFDLLLASPGGALILAAPFVGLYGLGALWVARRDKWSIFKILGAGVITLALLLVTGAIPAMFGLVAYSAPGLFPHELESFEQSLFFAGIAFYPWHPFDGYWGPVLIALNICGAVLRIRIGAPRASDLAKVQLFCTGAAIVAGVVLVHVSTWTGPPMLYMERVLWPFYALYAGYFVFWLISWIARRTPVPRIAMSTLIGIPLAVCIFAIARSKPLPESWNFRPSLPNTMSQKLVEDLKITPGQPFRGRVANFTGISKAGDKTWHYYHSTFDTPIQNKLSYDFRFTGLWHDSIPTLQEYNSFLTGLSYLMFSRLLSDPEDRQIRNILLFTKPDVPYLAAQGVRYALAEQPIDGTTVAASLQLDTKLVPKLYLNEIRSPNVGDYSPTEKISIANFTDGIARLRDSFDASKSVLLLAPLPETLVEADDAIVLVQRNGDLRVKGRSRGTSLLVLPFEYSNCRSLTAREGQGRMIRVNLSQTGLLFSGEIDATIRYRYGAFTNIACRFQDAADMRRFGAIEAAKAFPIGKELAPAPAK